MLPTLEFGCHSTPRVRPQVRSKFRIIYISNNHTNYFMEKLVIIGSGSGGIPVASTVAKFRKNQYDITVITKDRDIAYSPCGIPFVLKGDIPSYKAVSYTHLRAHE